MSMMMFNRDTIHGNLRLDRSCIFLEADGRVGSETTVSGRLFLSLSQSTPVKGISVLVKGRLKIQYDECILFKSVHEGLTFEQSQTLAASKKLSSFTLPAGDYEFPFEIPLNGKPIETIVGSDHEYHSYEVYGIIQRNFSKDVILSKPIQIYRPPEIEFNDIWASTSVSLQNHWDEKVDYSVSIPDVNIPFGSTFPVEFWLAPLAKGLKLGAITLEVIEKHEIQIAASAAYAAQYNVKFFTTTQEKTIFHEEHKETVDHVTTEGGLFEIEWRTEKPVRLPQSLDACTQHVNMKNIKINHVLSFSVELQNVEGHISIIKGIIPFNIFMSPQIIGQDGTIHSLDIQQFQNDKNCPPPLYGEHLTDSVLPEHLQCLEYDTGESMFIPKRLRHLGSSHLNYTELNCVPSYETAIRSNSVIKYQPPPFVACESHC